MLKETWNASANTAVPPDGFGREVTMLWQRTLLQSSCGVRGEPECHHKNPRCLRRGVVSQKSDYKYGVYLLDGLDKDDWYAENSRAIYIKTDNPDINSLDWKTSNGVYRYSQGVRRFADVNYLEIRDDLEVARVDGGYIMSIGFSDPESGDTLFGVCKGKNYINLMENSKCVASIPCKIKEYETEYKKAVKEIVRQSSAAGMDPFERMQAAVDYIEKKHPRYLANDGTYLYTFAAEPSDELWFKSWRFDSLTTPTILCAIAKEIGGFDKISNLYYDGNWSEHWYARVTIGNQSKDYTFCPDVSTGDIGEIRKINFMDTSKMTKIY